MRKNKGEVRPEILPEEALRVFSCTNPCGQATQVRFVLRLQMHQRAFSCMVIAFGYIVLLATQTSWLRSTWQQAGQEASKSGPVE